MRDLVMIEPRLTYARASTRLRQLLRNDHLVLSVLAIVVGAVVGISIVGFREAIDLFQGVFMVWTAFMATKVSIWLRSRPIDLVGALFLQRR